jgi:tRNA(Arg) A34 adenosine deaminase TadA
MCASAIRWAKLDRVAFCLGREAASRYGFADVVDPELSRSILAPSHTVYLEELDTDAAVPFEMWSKLKD